MDSYNEWRQNDKQVGVSCAWKFRKSEKGRAREKQGMREIVKKESWNGGKKGYQNPVRPNEKN